MRTYREQVERVGRMLDRINRQDRSPIEYGDDIWSFFQNCWHLKDWIQNDPGVPGKVRNSIEQIVKGEPSLMMCADLANASKHMESTRSRRTDAAYSHWNMAITPGESSKIEYVIDIGDGTQQDALQLARDCVKGWEQIFAQQGLT